MNLAGTVYLNKRAAQSFGTMRHDTRPVWHAGITANRRGQQEETT